MDGAKTILLRRPLDSWRSHLLWVSVVVYLAVLLRSWSSLPQRLAVHFSASGSVNGTASRGEFAFSTLLVLVGTVFILSLAARTHGRNTRVSQIAQYAFCYGFSGFTTAIPIRLIHYNLHGGARLSAATAAGLVCAALGAILGLGSPHQPGPVAPPAAGAAIIGQAVHRSGLQSAILCSLVAVFATLWITVGFLPFRIIVGFAVCVLGYFAALTTLGFRYLVSPADLRINWGFRRMEVVCASDIETVSIEPIHPVRDFGGWGARWSGRDRAYILKGKTAVKIETAGGNIFLGSNAPEGLLALLRRMSTSSA